MSCIFQKTNSEENIWNRLNNWKKSIPNNNITELKCSSYIYGDTYLAIILTFLFLVHITYIYGDTYLAIIWTFLFLVHITYIYGDTYLAIIWTFLFLVHITWRMWLFRWKHNITQEYNHLQCLFSRIKRSLSLDITKKVE